MGHKFSRAVIGGLLRLCDTLDERPDAWLLYGAGFRDALVGALADLDVMERRIAGLRGGQRNNRQGQPVTVRGRQGTVKARLWRDRLRVCEECGRLLTWATFHPHHIVRVADGGDDGDDNIRMLCSLCHDTVHAGAQHIA